MLYVLSRRPKLFVNVICSLSRIPKVFVNVICSLSYTVSIRIPSVYRQYSYTVSIQIPSVFVYLKYSYTRRRFLVGVGGAGVGAGAVWVVVHPQLPRTQRVVGPVGRVVIHVRLHLHPLPVFTFFIVLKPRRSFAVISVTLILRGSGLVRRRLRGVDGGVSFNPSSTSSASSNRASTVANSLVSRPWRISSFNPALANSINCCSVRSPTIGKL
ncbi:hypothetical protein HID58_037775 [Brassica napus]|uniref:Uncharacterized protein n=1 Tax=Brassica napus TaxID=3708 RepID=A0ABQ8BNP6_BRANA|nr:hypothetical protein HID58_037775 [Brassica napus]